MKVRDFFWRDVMDLVILAAGMGSRFGGLKQIEPIDEDANFILDYSAFDAVRAGFDRVVLIIRKEHQEIFEESVGKRLKSKIPVEYIFQDMSDIPLASIPEGRSKPWGTAHALYCCRNKIADKFAVINADDFYGSEPFEIVADFLRESDSKKDFISAGFMAFNTLTENGAVKRGLFSMDGDFATSVVESEVANVDGKIYATDLGKNSWREISPETMTSMTMFGFTKSFLDQIEKDINKFFAQNIDHSKSEFLLVDVLNDMIKNGEATLKIQKTSSKWLGVTYKEDLAKVKNGIQNLKDRGVYPKNLYAKNGNESTCEVSCEDENH
jgi:NDP-sugar pyrophosphorylase family protein